jgi:hypothetical protein
LYDQECNRLSRYSNIPESTNLHLISFLSTFRHTLILRRFNFSQSRALILVYLVTFSLGGTLFRGSRHKLGSRDTARCAVQEEVVLEVIDVVEEIAKSAMKMSATMPKIGTY